MSEELRDRRVTVMGLGRFGGGVGVTRWLAEQGARVLVTDLAPQEKLRDSLAALTDLNLELRLGKHRERDFRETALVIVNPAVPDDSPFLAAAREAGVPITTEINLFVERCPGRCVGVTGSVGKSTITAMIGHVLKTAAEGAEGPRPPFRYVWVGGNIGSSLLGDLPRISPDDVVVLELSSFQLQYTPAVPWSPHIAVIANVTPNHLDRHRTFAAYLAAKLNILRFQDPARDVIVIQDVDELKRNLALLFGDVAGMWRYGLQVDTPVAVMQSTPAADADDRRLAWPDVRLQVPGRHNRLNSAAALAVTHALGVPADAAVAALATFEALPHRLQRVAVRDGVSYFDDSKSTTPEAARTALDAFDAPVLMILGGYDKGIDLSSLASDVAARARFAACIGQTGEHLAELIRAAGGSASFCGELGAALAECRARTQSGDTVLLSPACASWDQFVDYRARGHEFARLAAAE